MNNGNKLINEIKKKRQYNVQKLKINQIVSRIIGIKESNFNKDSIIKMLNDADELDILEIITEIENEYHIVIPDEIFSSFKRVGDFYEYINKNVK